jgi:SPOR domain
VPRNAARDALIADLRARQRAALMAAPSAKETDSAEQLPEVTETLATDRRRQAPRVKAAPSITEPTFVSGVTREPVKSRRTLYWILSLAVLAAIGVGAWLVIRQQLAGRQTQAAETTNTAPPDVPQFSPQAPATNALLYSVAIEAHQQLPLALERVRALREEEPEMDFYITPVVANNVMYYQVMAGPVVDSASAGALLLRLFEKGHKTGAQPGDVRRADLAFLLGEYESRTDAETRESEAAELGIPGYVIEVQVPDETIRYRVYAGAFTSSAEAAVMRQLLQSVGLPDSLVQRVGKQR